MARQKQSQPQQQQQPAPQRPTPEQEEVQRILSSIRFNLTEVTERDDLIEKVYTLMHAKSILIGREDDPTYIGHIDDMIHGINGQLTRNAQMKFGAQLNAVQPKEPKGNAAAPAATTPEPETGTDDEGLSDE